ncbi:MAG: hypothetical protein CK423_06875 [Legionella sp.]|nr:MAG: hypothetical protein CK423_06875 [Legionella sp.]
MPRITISLPQTTYNRLTSLSVQQNDSMSNIINQLMGVGLNCLAQEADVYKGDNKVDKHCHMLTIQMNALLKKVSAEVLKLEQNDFDTLWKNTEKKYYEIQSNDS